MKVSATPFSDPARRAVRSYRPPAVEWTVARQEAGEGADRYGAGAARFSALHSGSIRNVRAEAAVGGVLGGSAPTAAARRQDLDGIPGSHLNRHLVSERNPLRLVTPGPQPVFPRRTGLSSS